MSTKYLKTIVFISIGVLCVVIIGVFGMLREEAPGSTQPQHETLPETGIPVSPQVFPRYSTTPQESLTQFQKSDFYRTIVDNNLFRPLGWTPPRPRELYRLLGTLLPRDAETPKQAILQSTTTGRTATATLGEPLDKETTVVDITSKQVTLENAGVRRTLKLH